MSSDTLTRRPVQEDDLPFLLVVYGSTRAEEMAQLPWSDDQKSAFLKSQLECQSTYYAQVFPSADREVLLVDGEPAGRFYVARGENEIHVIDIALLPPFRNRGIGSRLLGEILAEGERTGVKVTIYVEKTNPAQRLYLRLGFVIIDQDDVYFLMARDP
jgi:ribosomal protein S18 acetylase RimI-like enzyme